MKSDITMDQADRLCQLLKKRIEEGSEHQFHYERISSILAETRLEKCKRYGEDRYANDKTDGFQLWMCFSDVYRKFIRLQQLTDLVNEGKEEYLEDLIDAYLDISNYGIMAVQVLCQQFGLTIKAKKD